MNKSIQIILWAIFLFTKVTYAQFEYSQVIQPIFSAHCVSCHGGLNNVFLNNYDAVLNSVGLQYATNIVIPGNATGSPLYDKISSANPTFGGRMPEGGPYLSAEQINLIAQWINEGALATSIESDQHTPSEFRIVGNYPNPFNPTTNIRIEAPLSSEYTLQIHSLDGKIILETHGFVSIGTSNINVQLLNKPSGIYLYHITMISNNSPVQHLHGKMVLIK
jgi:mono/diheme cytochrome c family protein